MVNKVNKLITTVKKVDSAFSMVSRVKELVSIVTMAPCNDWYNYCGNRSN